MGISGLVIEDFEDATLVPGLQIELAGSTNPYSPTNILPRVFNPSVDDPNTTGEHQDLFVLGVWNGAQVLWNRQSPIPVENLDLEWGDVIFHLPGGQPNFLDATVTKTLTSSAQQIANVRTNADTRVQDEGSNLTQRKTLDFRGASVTATDSGSKTTVTIPGATGGGSAGPDGSGHVYVSESGSDTADGLSWQTAVATIHRALQVRANQGGTTTIEVGKGSFNGDFEIGGSDVLRGAGRDNTIIRGSSTFNGTVIRTEDGSATTVEGVRVLSDNPQFTGTLYHQQGAHGIIRDSDLRNESGRQSIAGGTYGGTALYINSGEGNLAENLSIANVHLSMNIGSTGNTVRKVNGGQIYKVLETEDLADCNNQPTFPNCVLNGAHSGHNKLEQSKWIEVSGPVAAGVANHGGWDFRNVDCCESSGALWRFADGNHAPQEDGVTVEQSVLTNAAVESDNGQFNSTEFRELVVTGKNNVFNHPVTWGTPKVAQRAVDATVVNFARTIGGAWPTTVGHNAVVLGGASGD